ncbi:dTMP kinase [Chloroflexia bacterium SDU3-3]|nr:dTMP kinase [Chloroflexia bacterium SDU3-3]
MSLFITFEGPEGSGKSTQSRLLYEYMVERGYPVILVREPGGTRISDMIRRIVLDLHNTEILPMTETLLFSAARAQLVHEVIRPYLAHDGIVLCDRYADSTYAYQGFGLGRDMSELRILTEMATGGLQPDMTIYLDLSAEDGLERKARARERLRSQSAPLTPMPEGRTGVPVEWNRLDARELEFHKRVEEGYRQLINESKERWHVFNACLAVEEIAAQIGDTVESVLHQS